MSSAGEEMPSTDDGGTATAAATPELTNGGLITRRNHHWRLQDPFSTKSAAATQTLHSDPNTTNITTTNNINAATATSETEEEEAASGMECEVKRKPDSTKPIIETTTAGAVAPSSSSASASPLSMASPESRSGCSAAAHGENGDHCDSQVASGTKRKNKKSAADTKDSNRKEEEEEESESASSFSSSSNSRRGGGGHRSKGGGAGVKDCGFFYSPASGTSGSRFDILVSKHTGCGSSMPGDGGGGRRDKKHAAPNSKGNHERGGEAGEEEEEPGKPCRIPTQPPYTRLQRQPFSHILVCDFEATCDAGTTHYPHEIIEFPVVVLDTASLRVVAQFHRYVRPTRHPRLTRFCTELTGIEQSTVDAADTLPVVLGEFQRWLAEVVYPLCERWRARHGAGGSARGADALIETRGLAPTGLARNLNSQQKRFVYRHSDVARAIPSEEKTAHTSEERDKEKEKTSGGGGDGSESQCHEDTNDSDEISEAERLGEPMICFATDGPWDMRHFMHECAVLRDGISFPPLFYRYINVRHAYTTFFKRKQAKLTHMLAKMGMHFEGSEHSGLDDARNITRVLADLLARGYRVHHVSTIKFVHRGDKFLEGNRLAQELIAECEEEEDERRRAKQQQQSDKRKKQQQQQQQKQPKQKSAAAAAKKKKKK